MLLALHVTIALVSVISTGRAYIRPSKKILSLSQWLIGATLVSGTALVVEAHTGLVPACLSGIVYLAIVITGILGARKKLTAQVDYS